MVDPTKVWVDLPGQMAGLNMKLVRLLYNEPKTLFTSKWAPYRWLVARA
jgi:hypothetical protein